VPEEEGAKAYTLVTIDTSMHYGLIVKIHEKTARYFTFPWVSMRERWACIQYHAIMHHGNLVPRLRMRGTMPLLSQHVFTHLH